jgi:hypothetical protein
MNPMRPDVYPPRANQGFVLVAVLVALVILTLLATAIATSSERAVQEARQNSEAFEAEVAMTSTRDTLLFMFTTQRRTFGGLTVDQQVVWSAGEATADRPRGMEDSDLPPMLPIGNEIRFDGTAYQGLDGISFALQDDASRYSPNWTFDLYRPGFLTQLGVPPELWPELEAKRLDYQDPDDLFRIGGAERADYLRKGMRPPANRTLVTPLELRHVMGWNEALKDLDDGQVVSDYRSHRDHQRQHRIAASAAVTPRCRSGDGESDRGNAARPAVHADLAVPGHVQVATGRAVAHRHACHQQRHLGTLAQCRRSDPPPALDPDPWKRGRASMAPGLLIGSSS